MKRLDDSSLAKDYKLVANYAIDFFSFMNILLLDYFNIMTTTEILTMSVGGKKSDTKLEDNRHPIVKKVEERLTYLHSLKVHRIPKYWQFLSDYAQRDIKTATEDGYAAYWMNTWFAIVNAKIADIITNTPKYDFVALDENWKKYKRVRELFWKYVWQESKTDAAIMKIVLDALRYGIWFGEEVVESRVRTVKMPKLIKDGSIVYDEKTINEYKGCKLNYIPWMNVYLNGTSLDSTTEAIVLSYWDRNEFIKVYGADKRFSWVSEDNIPKWKYYYVGHGTSSIHMGWAVWTSTTDRGTNSLDATNTVTILTYYNKYRDEYVVVANGKWINPLGGSTNLEGQTNPDNIQPIPYPHKEIPLVAYTDHVVPDDIWWLGELDITERSRQLKDDIRSLHIEWIKSQAWIITVDPDSDFDETVMRLGNRQIARVAKDAFWFFAPSVNLNSLEQLERKVDEDLIIECGVDFKSQLFWPNETAARTEWRISAAKKRINHNIKENAYNFYERLARLRSANFEFTYKATASSIPTKWVDVDEYGNVTHVNNWYGMFSMKPKYFSWKIGLLPIVDSLYWDTSSEQKQKYLETLQLLINMKDGQWAPLFDQKLLIEAGRGIIDEVIDLDKVLGKTEDVKSPEDIMREQGLDEQLDPNAAGWGMNPWGIPPEQQSGRPTLLGSSPKL